MNNFRQRFLYVCLLLVLSFSAMADSAAGTFTAPTERVDGSSLSTEEISHYNVYVNGILDIVTLPSYSTSFTIEVPVGDSSLNITTVDVDGRESDFSDTIAIRIKGRPKAPLVNTKVTITISNGAITGIRVR